MAQFVPKHFVNRQQSVKGLLHGNFSQQYYFLGHRMVVKTVKDQTKDHGKCVTQR